MGRADKQALGHKREVLPPAKSGYLLRLPSLAIAAQREHTPTLRLCGNSGSKETVTETNTTTVASDTLTP